MALPERAFGGSRSIAWTDALGAGALMLLVTICGGVGIGLLVVHLLERAGLHVTTSTAVIVHRAFGL